jgi:hypothetical protein
VWGHPADRPAVSSAMAGRLPRLSALLGVDGIVDVVIASRPSHLPRRDRQKIVTADPGGKAGRPAGGKDLLGP